MKWWSTFVKMVMKVVKVLVTTKKNCNLPCENYVKAQNITQLHTNQQRDPTHLRNTSHNFLQREKQGTTLLCENHITDMYIQIGTEITTIWLPSLSLTIITCKYQSHNHRHRRRLLNGGNQNISLQQIWISSTHISISIKDSIFYFNLYDFE